MSFIVDRDMFQPDMAAIVLANQDDIYTAKSRSATTIEIKVGDDRTSIYKGEIVGLEPIYKGGEKTTHPDPRDEQAASPARASGSRSRSPTRPTSRSSTRSSATPGSRSTGSTRRRSRTSTSTSTTRRDLEFLRTRAARIGCHVWCVDTKVNVKQPDLRADSSRRAQRSTRRRTTATCAAFTPRLDSSRDRQEGHGQGLEPGDQGADHRRRDASELASSARRPRSPASGDLGNDETFTVDHPIWSAARRPRRSRRRACRSSRSATSPARPRSPATPTFDLGKIVKIDVNADGRATIRSTASTTSWASPTAHIAREDQGRRLRHHPSPRARRAEAQ